MIAIIGCITLFLAATIAITAVDIKRVLAYSTVSQLGFMMLALGLGGWVAGLFHLITHAFFKSLLFLCSGSVIHAVHTNDMRQMGGLRHKMPITAYTMLVGCLAIAGVGIPFVLGFSGFHSKDVIVEQAIHFGQTNGGLLVAVRHPAAVRRADDVVLHVPPVVHDVRRQAARSSSLRSCPRSPRVMTVPLVMLAVFAVCAGWTLPSAMPTTIANFGVENLLDQARPVGMLGDKRGVLMPDLVVPDEHRQPCRCRLKSPPACRQSASQSPAFWCARIVYVWELMSAATLRRSLNVLYHATWNKWWFDELYDFVFVRPTLCDRPVHRSHARPRPDRFDLINSLAYIYRGTAAVVSVVGDRWVIDNFVDTVAAKRGTLASRCAPFKPAACGSM